MVFAGSVDNGHLPLSKTRLEINGGAGFSGQWRGLSWGRGLVALSARRKCKAFRFTWKRISTGEFSGMPLLRPL
jgi:hypothetical protein